MKLFTKLLKIIIITFGLVVLAWMIRFPQTEGRAANLDLISIYSDPLIIYGYIGITPFFVGLYQLYKLIGFYEQKQAFSKKTSEALNTIKYCALIFIGVVLGGEAWIIMAHDGKDDMAGAIAMGIFLIIATTIIGTTAAVIQKRFQNSKS